MKELIKLSDILLSVEHLPWQWKLFLPSHGHWSGNTLGAVLDTENEDDPDHLVFAQEQGLVSVSGISALQDIVDNAKQQDPNVGVKDLCRRSSFTQIKMASSILILDLLRKYTGIAFQG